MRRCRRLGVGLAIAICAGVFGGCRFSPPTEKKPVKPLPEQVSWNGLAPVAYGVEQADPTQSWDTLDGIREIRRHTLQFPGFDSLQLVLREYSRDYWAYAAFQLRTGREGFKQGFIHQGDALIFYHGLFVGELRSPLAGALTAQLLQENLVFQEEDFFATPSVFEAFPVQDRVPKSERVIPAHFLGKHWHGPVFCVHYRCGGDTATAFRAFPQARGVVSSWIREWQGSVDTLFWRQETHFQGVDEFQRPLVFWNFPGGVVGISDCFEPKLALTYAEKMKKMTVLWAKP